ncbi:MAG TPA: hypothetical protein VFA92_17445 [Candidatus Binatia bacterium]|jgi:hypothetical protein|nr:hypothetical protein [Candidatus Binatia bacterium]
MTADPLDVVRVEELTPQTVSEVIDRLEASRDFDHLVYREAEVDALWSLADMAARRREPNAGTLLDLLWAAHERIGEQDGQRAIEELRHVVHELRQAAPAR